MRFQRLAIRAASPTGAQITSVPAHPPRAFDVSFSSDSHFLASSGLDTTVKLWKVNAGKLELRHTLRGHVGWAPSSFSPDGRRLFCGSTGDSTLKIWDTDNGLTLGTIYGAHQGNPGNPGFSLSRNGDAIYSATETGEFRILRAPLLPQSPPESTKLGD